MSHYSGHSGNTQDGYLSLVVKSENGGKTGIIVWSSNKKSATKKEAKDKAQKKAKKMAGKNDTSSFQHDPDCDLMPPGVNC